MKYRNIFSCVCLFLISLHTSFAQSNSLQNENYSDSIVNSEQIVISDVSIGLPVFEDKVYQPNETVSVKVPLKNNDPVNYPDIIFLTKISVFSKDGSAREYNLQEYKDIIFLSEKGIKDVSFTYTLPNLINIKEGDRTRIEITFYQRTGQIIGYTSEDIRLGSFEKGIEIVNAFISKKNPFDENSKEFPLQAGPVVAQEDEIKINVFLKNPFLKDVSVYPKLDISNIQNGKFETIQKYDEILIKKSPDIQEFSFTLPKNIKPGVYVGNLELFDQNLKEITSPIMVRWIIDGDMATIPSVSIDKQSLKKGQKAQIEVIYTGAPINIETEKAREGGTGILTVTLYNEKDEVIASQQQDIDLSTLRDVASLTVTAQGNAKKILAEAVITKGETELARYATVLTNPEQEESSFATLLFSLASIIILLLIGIFLKNKFFKKSILVLMFVTLIFFGYTFETNAMSTCQWDFVRIGRGGKNLAIHCGVSSLYQTSFTPSEDMSWDLTVSSSAYVCQNLAPQTQVNWEIRDSNNNLISSNYFRNVSWLGYSGAVSLLSGNSFYPANANLIANSILAPAKPGSYKLVLGFQTYGSWFAEVHEWRSLASYYNHEHWFSVSCPSGQIVGSDGYCAWPAPLPVPTNLQTVCSPDGSTVTFSWTNAPGYDTVYFRNYDDTTGGWGTSYAGWYGYEDHLTGSTYRLTSVSHGHNYHWWIHTKNTSTGAYSDAVHGYFTCSPTPVDQCTNVSGIQTTVPVSATKNTDGTCSCSTGKHFEGAVCVDDPPVTPTLSVSCSAPSVILNEQSTFTATAQNNTGPVTYKWKEKDNTTYISGATDPVFKRTYSTVDSHRLYVEATDQTSTASNYCNATVDCNSSHYEGEKVCDTNTGIESTWSCSTSGWTASKASCSTTDPGNPTYTGSTPEVGTFTFTPNVVPDSSSKCGLNLSATNVSSCTLTAPGVVPIYIPGTSGAISKLNDRSIPVGRYNLSCTGMGVTPTTKQFGFKTCLLNPDVRER